MKKWIIDIYAIITSYHVVDMLIVSIILYYKYYYL